MSEKAGTFWGDLITGRYAFDTRESIAEQVATIPHARIINLYQQTIMDADSSWLLYSKGSQDVLVEGFEPLSTLDRAALPRFAHPESSLPTEIIKESSSQ